MTTPRLGLVQPAPGDSPTQFRQAIITNAAALDTAATWAQGTTFTIPAAGNPGRRFYVTDVGVELVDTGSSWVAVGSPTPIGGVTHWAGSGDPVDPDGVTRWLICDGRAISRSTYANLFTAISTTYGTGNGSTTFNIPDGRGRTLINAGAQTGCTTRSVGQTGAPTGATYVAEETHAVTNGEMAVHNHGGATGGALNQHGHVISDPGHQHNQGIQIANLTFNFGSQWEVWGEGSSTTSDDGTGIGVGGATARHAHAIDAEGGNTAHNNMQPFLVVNHIIKAL